MEQRCFINSWLLPCSLRSHRTANPAPNNGFAIIRLCPPTTQIQVTLAAEQFATSEVATRPNGSADMCKRTKQRKVKTKKYEE